MKSNKLLLIIAILLIFVFHYFFQNGLEKIFFQTFFPFQNIRRPLSRCNNIFNRAVSCVGMPSGHAESATIVSVLSYYYNFISLTICVLLIFVFSIQRVLVGMHTSIQVLVGILFGLIYSFIYTNFNLNYKGFIIVLCISLTLLITIVNHIDKQVHQQIPDWVSYSMLSSIKKKQESTYYSKILHILANTVVQQVTFISWSELQTYLDIIVEQIKETGIKYDAVIGVKTGGAILSDYISKKLQIKNYKIKLSKEKYNCDKKISDTIEDNIDRLSQNNYMNYMICEGIYDNIQDKNVILIDELVSSGNTISESYRYLKESKKVNNIYVTSVALYKLKFMKQNLSLDFKIHNIINNGVVVWPWGFDN